jgi:hypothetical protein
MERSFEELEKLYDQMTWAEEGCDHLQSEVVMVEDSSLYLYRWYCPDCQRMGWGNRETAIHLGWIAK